jgi:hypothetical protein
VRVWLGARSQFVSMFTQIPANVGLAAAVDFPAPVRAEVQVVAHPMWEGFQAMLSAGVPFHLYDGRGRGGSILQLKLPLQLAFGYLKVRWEASDGYNDRVSWLLLGPTLGLDFTWWVRKSLGVCFAAGGSYLFRIADPGSVYGGDDNDDDYSVVSRKPGLGEFVLSFGLAFG